MIWATSQTHREFSFWLVVHAVSELKKELRKKKHYYKKTKTCLRVFVGRKAYLSSWKPEPAGFTRKSLQHAPESDGGKKEKKKISYEFNTHW